LKFPVVLETSSGSSGKSIDLWIRLSGFGNRLHGLNDY